MAAPHEVSATNHLPRPYRAPLEPLPGAAGGAVFLSASAETMTDITYRPEAPADAPAILALTDRAFGPGRYAKAAERLREGNTVLRELSISAWRGEALLGSVRMWPVRVGEGEAVFLGPIAVEADERKHGIGQQLVEQACAAAAEAGWRCVFLVGDAPYFGRMGFLAAPGVTMPGPVDQRRVLWKPLADGAEAPVGPARA